MDALEYFNVDDKAAWGVGPWVSEPDKAQWVDPATGLDCLIVRNGGGALCGYVGVPESHPWFGKGYSACTRSPACEESWCGHSPESAITVHGGLTFADACHEPTRARWEKWRAMMLGSRDEAQRFPRGDSARRWKDAGHLVDDYDGWRAYGEARFICHRPLDGRPDRVWWFGFDCAHLGDVSPAFDALSGARRYGDETYRDRAFVEAEIAYLARQLVAVEVTP